MATLNDTAREYDSASTALPAIAILGASPFTCIISNAGGGETRYRDIVVNRWRSDPTLDDFGQWIYVKDITTGKLWSAAHQPVCATPASYRVIFEGDCATFIRRDGDIKTKMEIFVSPESATETRRVTLTNDSAFPHELELTSYAEIVIAPGFADRGHPAFQSLFVQTEWLPSSNAVLAMRRPRSATNKPIWCGHAAAISDGVGKVSCETDRARFIGRGRSARNPAAMDRDGTLSGRVGAVLDPVCAVRARVRIPPGGMTQVAFTTFVTDTRDEASRLAASYSLPPYVTEAIERCSRESHARRASLGVSAEEEVIFQKLASDLVQPARSMEEIPLIVASVQLLDGVADARLLARAHRYLASKGIEFDLTVLAHGDKLAQELASEFADNPRIEVVRSDSLDSSDLAEIMDAARMRVDCDGSGEWRFASDTMVADPPDHAQPPLRTATSPSGDGLSFFNGIGGFNDRNEYEIRLSAGNLPPAPWINVIGNPAGGFIASETGAGSTWIASGSSFRLSPWHNDPVSDRPGECIYVRDDHSKEIWSPTAAPVRDGGAYTVRHGAGYSVFEHEHDGIMTSLRMGMARQDPVKLQILELTNRSSRPRTLTIASYVEWVLGATRERTRFDVKASFDQANEVMIAVNPFDPDLPTTTAFHAISERVTGQTVSRREFIGRNGTLAAPAALVHGLSQSVEKETRDPCAALLTTLDLAPGEKKSIAVVLGAAEGEGAAKEMATRYRNASVASQAIDEAIASWRSRLDAVTVATPDPAFDLMLNQWAFYQALSCRVWGRNALYQSSGAFGFRDQLQDVMAFTYAEPALAREQIIRAASRQFEEGDVQHWWHPHSGRGLRTKFADDLVWLPFVVEHYIQVTGDTSVLDEKTPYLTGRLLEGEEDELYMMPDQSQLRASVFDHCVHILNRATTRGAHGLPLIGSGDWNDGMNRVGVGGRGESVWLGWFIAMTLRKFSVIADARGYSESAISFRRKANDYIWSIEQTSWDGEWYRRAYYDDGTPLGSHVNTECAIDSIAQSWSVISRAGDPERTGVAMASLHKHLVNEEARLIMLLTPAFDRGTHDPGYIQGYLPGVRENGAQYTHAALWAVMATALMGDGNHAMKLYQMINPITHASTPEDVATYKVEPYVVAADVYTAEGHVGRGGWTWYTGSASWLYRVGLESILGFCKRGDSIEISPCIPSSWTEFSLRYRFGSTVYSIVVQNPSGVQSGVASVLLDDDRCEGMIPLIDDGLEHTVLVTMG